MAVQENRHRLKGCAMLLAALAAWGGTAQAQQVCKEDLRVLSQPRDGLTLPAGADPGLRYATPPPSAPPSGPASASPSPSGSRR